MFWFFRIGFWLQLVIIFIQLFFNYVMYDSEQGLYFTVRGNIYAHTTQPHLPNLHPLDSVIHKTPATSVSRSKYGVTTLDTIGSKTIYMFNGQQFGFLRVDYTEFTKAFTVTNMLWFLADISFFLLWLIITYQIMKILQSIKDEAVFIQQNIKRITFIGWAFILMTFVEIVKDQVFFLVAKQHLQDTGLTLISNVNWYDLVPISLYSVSYDTMNHSRFQGIALGLIILVIAQIFKNGFELQKEKDLTI